MMDQALGLIISARSVPACSGQWSGLSKSSDPEKSMELDFYHGNFAAVLYSVAWLVMELALCGCTPRCTRPNFPRMKQSLSRLPKKLPFQIQNNPFFSFKTKEFAVLHALETSSTVLSQYTRPYSAAAASSQPAVFSSHTTLAAASSTSQLTVFSSHTTPAAASSTSQANRA